MPLHPRLRGRRHFRRLALVLAVTAFAGSSCAGKKAAANEPLFGTQEIHSSDLQMFPKWRGTMDRYAGEQKNCDPAKCHLGEWQALVERLRGKDLMTELREVNREMNAKPYITDPVNWNLPDYWATPFQFLRKDGDCEDYAIAKYMALRKLGVAIDDMRIVVLQDMNLGIAHAILAVYVKGTPYILDNQISTVVPAKAIHHYKPVYSVNENGWWLHRS
ncbi:MAG TPA: transglutaminase-like cysteine peptidase [Methylomirabilota bacterium]|nr:transglutaminase-like cysteine peptidase [Methylomirabilota bacterium]